MYLWMFSRSCKKWFLEPELVPGFKSTIWNSSHFFFFAFKLCHMVETVRCRHMLSNRMSCRHSDLDRGHFMLCKNHLAHKKKERKKATSGNKSWFMFPQRASYEKFTCCLIFSSYMCECVMLCNVVWCCVMLCNVV